MTKKQMQELYKSLLKISEQITSDDGCKLMYAACINLGRLIAWVDLELQDMDVEDEVE